MPELFPLPTHVSTSIGCLALSPSFTITLKGPPSPPSTAGFLLEQAAKRYEKIIASDATKPSAYYTCATAPSALPSLVIAVPTAAATAVDIPALEDDESYSISVDNSTASLKAASVWGAMRGLETFSQLLVRDDTLGATVVGSGSVLVQDFPRFRHRGLMIDTSRRYLTVGAILEALDAMAYAKLNVLHWHITDDQSFPLEVAAFPRLSGRGAYNAGHKTHVYSPAAVQTIIRAASARGIRVIPELDMPGHTHSWFKGHPELETSCPTATAQFGHPMNPISPVVDAFVRTLWHEVNSAFPDHYSHIGGDEVSGECWGANAAIRAYMLEHFSNASDFGSLQAVFESKVLHGNQQDGKASVLWQENFGDRRTAGYPPGTVVEIWKGNSSVASQTMRSVNVAGYETIFTCKEWYLNYQPWAHSARLDDQAEWEAVYNVEPLVLTLNTTADSLVQGAEACMWAPYQDTTNFMTTTFPRALAVAERLWSSRATRNITDAITRVSALRCRMLARGLPIPPVNSGGWGTGILRGDFCPTPFAVGAGYESPYV